MERPAASDFNLPNMNAETPNYSSTNNDEQQPFGSSNQTNESLNMYVDEASTSTATYGMQQSNAPTSNTPSSFDKDMQQPFDLTAKTPKKRAREADNEEIWNVVTKSGKRYARSNQNNRVPEEKIEVSVTSKEPLPKQFAFARLLKIHDITSVLRVRYINAYKVIIQFENEECLCKLLECQYFINKGWNIQRTLEVGVSYGVIRNVEMELSESEILESITSTIELISVKRLNRKVDDGKRWAASETIRLCFKGASLPAYVHIHGVRTNIHTYTFPVTQCSFCWRYGHPKKVCPKKKQVCVKCTKEHENCETAETNFLCANCRGNHMAMSPTCPVRIKERKIREIMAEFNCSYKRALTMYAPPDTPPPQEYYTEFNAFEENQDTSYTNMDNDQVNPSTSYAAAAALKPSQDKKNPPKNKNKIKKIINKKTKHSDDDIHWDEIMNQASDSEPTEEKTNERTPRKERGHISFYELLKRLSNIILDANHTIYEKVTEVLKICCKWLYNMVRNYIPDINFLKNIINTLWIEH